MAAASLATCWVHVHWDRGPAIMAATRQLVELNALLGMPVEDPSLAPNELMDDPRSAAFLELAADQVKRFVEEEPNLSWDRIERVWVVPFGLVRSDGAGWPFVSNLPTSTVWIEISGPPVRGQNSIPLTITEQGRSRIALHALCGNWLTFATLAVFAFWVLSALWRVIRQQTTQDRGFPVIPIADNGDHASSGAERN
jgi:hypothetical protein